MIEIYLVSALENYYSYSKIHSIILKGNIVKNKWIAIKSKEEDIDSEYFEIKKKEIKSFNIY